MPALLVAFFFTVAGCLDAAESPDSAEEEALRAEADRRNAPADEAVEVIADERSVERRIRDASTAAKIRSALVEADDLRRFDFDPVVVNGRVMLRGEVQTQDQRRRAAQITEDIDGVRSVVNEVAATEEPTPEEPPEDKEDLILAGRTDTADADATRESAEATADEAETSQDESAARDDAAEPAAEDETVYHTVNSGESLWTISRRHGVSIDQIRRLNNLGSSSTLRPGQRLRIK